MKIQVAKKVPRAGNRKKIPDTVMWIVVIAIIAFVIIFFFPEPLSEEVHGFSGYNCISAAYHFTCSLNISYSPTGQISLNATQKTSSSEIYNVTFICLSDNTTLTNVTKTSGFINTTNDAMPYDVVVHASDIRCYNREGPVYVSPNTTFHGILYVNFTTSNGRHVSGEVGAIAITGKG